MFTFIATLHILVALGLIFMVLVQDSKGGAAGGMFGGGGSQSILGATGAVNLFVKITRWLAVVFAVTCMLLTIMVARRGSSVLDGAVPPHGASLPAAAPVTAPADAGKPADAAAEAAKPADAAKPAAATPEKK